jgi:hypothetical protein
MCSESYMNCRIFHNKLEDYLQDGLDFSSRFAIERHAQQCIGCGKELADAIELRRMVLDLKRVKAPANFESALLDKIWMYKVHGRFSALRRFWLYGPEWLSWNKMILASSGLAVLVLGIIASSHLTIRDHPAPPPVVAGRPEKVEEKAKPVEAAKIEPALPKPSHSTDPVRASLPERMPAPMPVEREIHKAVAVSTSYPIAESESYGDMGEPATDSLGFIVSGMDVRPEPVRMLPKKIRLQYRPASEEYFIQNVSH